MPIDMSAAKAPPRRNTRVSAPKVAEPSRTARERRTEGLMGIGQLAQAICAGTKQYADAATIGQHWGNIAPELATLADEYDVLAKPVDMLIQVGPFGALLAAVLPFGMQILTNHKVIAPGTMGSVPPELLETQMKTQIMQAQAVAMREQQKAMREAQSAQAEVEKMMREMNAETTAA